MSRVLLTWELGMNLGHLARLLPLALGLRARGHTILLAVREIPAAAAVLGPRRVPFLQAPHVPAGLRPPELMSSYADVLLDQGWSDARVLGALTDCWLNLMRMYAPDIVVLDHSPTALLALRVAAIPAVLIGNGFEVPLAGAPLPSFPGLPWATAECAAAAEHRALDQANKVLAGYEWPALASLHELFSHVPTRIVSFPELDHYGVRSDEHYVGPLMQMLGNEAVSWPAGRRRVFASLRPDNGNLESILAALRQSDASVVCFVPGSTPKRYAHYSSERLQIVCRPVKLDSLLQTADLCITNGAEGTIAAFLHAGVPQLISPQHIEASLISRRIEALGAGLALHGAHTAAQVSAAIERLTEEPVFAAEALAFSERHIAFDPGRTIGELSDLIGRVSR